MSDILLIPGNMCDERLWEPVAERTAKAGYHVQHSPRLNQGTIGAMAETVLAAINAPIIVIGFSMGAIVAAEMARLKPTQIMALGLIAFNATADSPERAAVRPRQQQQVREGRLEEIVAGELKPNYLANTNRGNADMLHTVMQMALGLGPETFVAQSEALRLRDDLRPALPRLAMPVMLSCGAEDRLCPPEWHRNWTELIGANASFIEIPQAGHLLPLEQPDALADAIMSWLTKDAICPNLS